MAELLREIRHALRTLVRSPSFTIASVLALCLAIGANTAVFSVVHSLLTLPIPFAQPERVAFVFAENDAQNVQQGGLAVDDFLDFRERLQSFSGLAASVTRQYNVVGAGEPQRVPAAQVTPGFFDMAGVRPVAGRAFRDEEGRSGNDRVVIIGHAFWRQSLGSDPEVVGQSLRLDGESHLVVGIAPEKFTFAGTTTDLWTPLVLERGATPRDQRTLVGIGRLRDGVSSQQATAEAAPIAEQLAAAHPATHEGWTARVVTVPETLRQGVSFITVLLYASISFVLLIACVNIANLLLARALAREREIALRSFLGASRLRIARQLLVESVMLALWGGAAGLVVGAWAIRVLRVWIAPDPNVGFIADTIRMSWPVAGHAIAVSAAAGILFGLVPAIRVARADIVPVLKEGGRGGEGRRRGRLRAALVMGEVALALALLITAGTLIRAFDKIYQADPGFDTADLLTLQLALPTGAEASDSFAEGHQQAQFFDNLLARLESLPGARSAAATSLLPLTRLGGPGTSHAEIEGRAVEERQRAPNVNDAVVSAGYFSTFGIPLRQGRAFDDRDREGGEPVAMVTESFIEQFAVEGEVVGMRLRLKLPTEEQPGPWRRVIGVVADHATHAHSLRQPRPKSMVYLPMEQVPRPAMAVAVRTRTPPAELAQSAREAVWQVAPTLPIQQVQSLEQTIAAVDTQNTFFLRILSGLALVALGLAAVGIYGLITFSVNQRRREIGIRMALGARSANTVGLVARQTAWLTTVGLVAGSGLAYLLVNFMTNQLEGLAQSNAGSVSTFGAVAAFFIGVALVASALPAWRALRVDPVHALREE